MRSYKIILYQELLPPFWILVQDSWVSREKGNMKWIGASHHLRTGTLWRPSMRPDSERLSNSCYHGFGRWYWMCFLCTNWWWLLPVYKLDKGFSRKRHLATYNIGWPVRFWGVSGIPMAHAMNVACRVQITMAERESSWWSFWSHAKVLSIPLAAWVCGRRVEHRKTVIICSDNQAAIRDHISVGLGNTS